MAAAENGEPILGPQEPNLDFMVAFDGTQPEVSEADSELVAIKFESFVEDMILAHLTDAESLAIGTRLHLKKPDRRGFEWRLEPELPSYAGAVLLVGIDDGSRQLEERHRYSIAADERIVRRTSSTVMARRIQPSEPVVDIDFKAFTNALNEDRNKALEQNFGIDGQPIGLQEIEGLIAFAQQQGFAVDQSRYFKHILEAED